MTSKTAELFKEFHENVDSVLDRQPPMRRKKDAQKIRKVRSLMMKSPLGKELLKWADDHGIRIVIDRQTQAGGYYYPGYKIVALNGNLDNLTLTGTLAHEIRHAWQDSHGMIPSLTKDWHRLQSAGDYIAQIKLIEADAFAVGEAVKRSVSDKCYYERREEWALQFPEKAAEQNMFTADPVNREDSLRLARNFRSFFVNAWRRDFYEDRCLKTYARHIGVADIKIPCGTGEYFDENTKSTRHQDGIDLYNPEQLRLLGDLLGRGNYMDHLSPEKIGGDDYYRRIATISRKRQKNLRQEEDLSSQFRTRSGIDWKSVVMREEKTPQDVRKDNNLLYSYVKHLHKQHRMG